MATATGYLTRVKGTFYYARRVPEDVADRVGKKFWRSSLRTKDRREAVKRARPIADEHDALIERLRSVDDSRMVAIGKELEALGFKVSGGDGRWDLASIEDSLRIVRAKLTEAQNAAGIRFLELAEKVDLDDAQELTFTGRRYERLREEQIPILFTEQRLEAIRAEVAGEAKPIAEPSQSQGLRYAQRIWQKRASPTELSVGEADVAVRRFIDVNGDLALTEITKEHVRAFRAVLERLPRRIPNKRRDMAVTKVADLTPQDGSVDLLSAASVRKQIGFLRTVLSVAENDGLIETNPASGIRIVDDRDEKARLPFDEEHLRRMFAKLPTDDPTFYWMVTLAYMTGARLSEIGRLTTDNVRTEDGVTFFEILDGKTVNARRRIPVHPALIELGFLDYVATRNGPLTDHVPDTKGRPAGHFQKRFGRWLRLEAKVTDRRRTFHSFRHGFRDMALSAGIDEVLIERLQGWAPATAGRGYGRGASIKRLAEAVESIGFPARPAAFNLKRTED